MIFAEKFWKSRCEILRPWSWKTIKEHLIPKIQHHSDFVASNSNTVRDGGESYSGFVSGHSHAHWFIWEVCDFTYLGIIHDWDHWSICPWNEVNFKGSGARLTPQNLQTCPRSVPKMALKKVSREFLNQCGMVTKSILYDMASRSTKVKGL